MLASLPFWTLFGALAGVGLVSWRRTGPLRHGRVPDRPPSPIRARASPTTHLAWLAGSALLGWGLRAWLVGWTGGILLAAAGLFVAGAGSIARVTRVLADGSGLLITYAARRPYGVRWEECDQLEPPRMPLGGWRVGQARGSRTLMPSDLLGHEDILGVIVRRAGLRFDGRAWRRGKGQGWTDVRKGVEGSVR